MRICFPVLENRGMESLVYNHFGSAPMFIVVDTDSNEVQAISNNDQHHVHGACNPVMAMNGEYVDAVVVGGIGAGALNKLNQRGIRVFRALGAKVIDNVELLRANTLPQFSLQHTCAGHGGLSGCSH